MTLETYLLYVGASVVLVLVPGPDMIYLLTRSIAQGRRAGVAAALGITAGAYVHLFAAITGLSAILLTSAVAFSIVKWVGAAYLIYLGLKALLGRKSSLDLSTSGLARTSLRAIFWQGFLSDVLNPKVAIFFLALLPQFVNTHASNPAGQLLRLGVTGNIIGVSINVLLVHAAASVSRRLRNSAKLADRLQKLMGMVFIGLGVRLAAERS